jgi:hypothetical protein
MRPVSFEFEIAAALYIVFDIGTKIMVILDNIESSKLSIIIQHKLEEFV